MDGNPDFEELNKRLEKVSEQQQGLQNEIADIKKTIAALRWSSTSTVNPVESKPIEIIPLAPQTTPKVTTSIPVVTQPEAVNVPPFVKSAKKEKTPLEEFIGTNLLNKIGIAVVVIGIGIGAEYAIDNNLITPLTRIILGYLCGVALIGVAIRMKAKYENFSAVLLSGGMAVLYLITFAAYSLYGFFPQPAAFAIMVMFTVFTVYAALQYNIQVIAIIALVGAYAVPVLLSNDSGNVKVLFIYMSIINCGILVLGFKKSWRLLNYIAFVITWIIFLSWGIAKYRPENLWLELIFSTIFFAIFYVAVLAYKIIRDESLTKKDITFVLINSFIYYGLGYYAINDTDNGEVFLGIFTVFNAILHFIVCYVIFRNQAQSRGIFLFAAGLVLVFLTLAVPVQLDGNWVTIVWACEAALLFFLGRSKGYPGYEKLSYPLIVLALASLFQDWSYYYSLGYDYNGFNYDGRIKVYLLPFLNVQLLSSLIVCAALAIIVKISHDKKYVSPLKQGYIGNELMMKGVPIALTLVLFGAFFHEVQSFWQQRFAHSQLSVHRYGESEYIRDYNILNFKNIWVLIYCAIFVLVGGAVNYFKIKNRIVSYVAAAAGTLVVFMLITAGLINAAELRNSYLQQTDGAYYYRTIGHLLIRYVVIAFAFAVLFMNYKITRQDFIEPAVRKAERLFLHFTILVVLSSELVTGLALINIIDSDKLALSILWGSYALGMIVFGLIKDLKYIRIAAISLFGVTLVKLFFYDMSGMGTISKTVVMIVLGVLLLVASFLYNKFKKPADEKK